MKSGDLLQLRLDANAWRRASSINTLGKLRPGDVMIFYERENGGGVSYVRGLSKFGVCSVLSHKVRIVG
jgi:hypothetical protein